MTAEQAEALERASGDMLQGHGGNRLSVSLGALSGLNALCPHPHPRDSSPSAGGPSGGTYMGTSGASATEIRRYVISCRDKTQTQTVVPCLYPSPSCYGQGDPRPFLLLSGPPLFPVHKETGTICMELSALSVKTVSSPTSAMDVRTWKQGRCFFEDSPPGRDCKVMQ